MLPFIRHFGDAFAESVTLGAPAPDVSATRFDGKPITLSDLKGQVLLVNLWATWCDPVKPSCRCSKPTIGLQGTYGLRVGAVSTETPHRESEARCRASDPFDGSGFSRSLQG
ncbi:MAG: TlpA family protein disulfide reductase, partial [Rhizomicrobium sp.]